MSRPYISHDEMTAKSFAMILLLRQATNRILRLHFDVLPTHLAYRCYGNAISRHTRFPMRMRRSEQEKQIATDESTPLLSITVTNA